MLRFSHQAPKDHSSTVFVFVCVCVREREREREKERETQREICASLWNQTERSSPALSLPLVDIADREGGGRGLLFRERRASIRLLGSRAAAITTRTAGAADTQRLHGPATPSLATQGPGYVVCSDVMHTVTMGASNGVCVCVCVCVCV